MTERCSTRFRPFPELVEPVPGTGPYEIIDTRTSDSAPEGRVNLTQRRMYVPLDSRGRHVSRHELGHVRWSPLELPECGVPPMVLLAVEDARINLGLRRSEVPVDADAIDWGLVMSLGGRDLIGQRLTVFTLRSVAAIGTNLAEPMRVVLAEASPSFSEFVTDLVDLVERRLVHDARQAPVADFETVIELGREVSRRLAARGLALPTSAPTCCLSVHISKRDDSAGTGAGGGDGEGGRRGSGDDLQAGKLSIRSPELAVDLPRAALRRANKWRAAEEGSVLRHVHRALVDGRVFRRQARGRAGSVLIDTSGSMSLDAGGVERILTAARGTALVAIYSGRGDEGELRVVARGSRRVGSKDLEPFGSGNVVDLPALEWLARQRGPRIWITDGHVTGVGDRGSRELRSRCRTICKRARVHLVPDVEAATAILTKGARTRPRGD